MDIDPRAMPAPEATEDLTKEILAPKATDETVKNEAPVVNENLNTELELLKTKNLELQKQKEHWREKYERDITIPKPSEEPEYLTDDEVTRKELLELKRKFASLEDSQALEKLSILYPAIKDKADEFNEFKADYPGVAMDKIAKIFVSEKGYTEQLNQKKGLEKPTSGSKSQHKSGMSQDEVKRLREDQPRRYQQMLRSGKLNPDDIV